jgi:hypothetical protein
MKKLTLLLVFLFSWPLISKAEDKSQTNVDVRLNTPAGQVEVTKQPPPPVVVVPAQPPQRVVVEKEAPPPPPPPPSGGCHCSLVPSLGSLSGVLSLAPAVSLFFLLRWKKRRQLVDQAFRCDVR